MFVPGPESDRLDGKCGVDHRQVLHLPLQVEILYNEYLFVAAFAVASMLALLAIVTLVIKTLVEWRADRRTG